MAGVDELFQVVRCSISVMGSEEIGAVIAPAPVAGELVHGHELNMRNAQVHQMVETLDSAQECAIRSKCSDVQFVNHGAGERARLPVRVGPTKPGVIDKLRGTVDALWLKRGPRVGDRLAGIELQ